MTGDAGTSVPVLLAVHGVLRSGTATSSSDTGVTTPLAKVSLSTSSHAYECRWSSSLNADKTYFLGHITIDGYGNARMTVRFAASGVWYSIFGSRANVVVPSLTTHRPGTNPCLAKTAELVGGVPLEKSASATLDARIQQPSRDLEILQITRFDGSTADANSIDPQHLVWSMSARGEATSAVATGAATVRTPETIASASGQSFGAALALGLALTALFDFVRGFPNSTQQASSDDKEAPA